MRKLILCCIAMWAAPALAGPFTVSSTSPTSAIALKLGVEWKDLSAKDTVAFPKVEFKMPLSRTVEFDIEAPYKSIDEVGGEAAFGPGDMEVKSKWNFYRGDRLAFAVEPTVTFPTGSHRRGLGEGDTTLLLPLIVGYRTGAWEIGSELGYKRVFRRRANSAYLGALLLRRVAPGLKVGMEIVTESPDARPHQLATRADIGLKWHFGRGYKLEALAGRTLHTPIRGGFTNRYKLALEKKF